MRNLQSIAKQLDEMEAAASLILNNCSRVRQELAQFSGSVPAGRKGKGLSKEQATVFSMNFKKRFKKTING